MGCLNLLLLTTSTKKYKINIAHMHFLLPTKDVTLPSAGNSQILTDKYLSCGKQISEASVCWVLEQNTVNQPS